MPHRSWPVSLTVLIVLAVLTPLLLYPYSSVILTYLGIPLLAEVGLVHVFFIALAVEAITRRVPLVLIVIPIAAYGWYYVQYFQEIADPQLVGTVLRAANPGRVLSYDPKQHAIVVRSINDLDPQRHDIAVVYQSYSSPEHATAWRLLAGEQCNIPVDIQHEFRVDQIRRSPNGPRCTLVMPETPAGTLFTLVERKEDTAWARAHHVRQTAWELRVDEQLRATYRTARVERLLPFPLLVLGCGLNDANGKLDCYRGLYRFPLEVDTAPAGLDTKRYDTPLSIMLGIPRYSDTEWEIFRGHPENTAASLRASRLAASREGQGFELLQAILDGKDVKVPTGMGDAISKDPRRLAPYAEAMVKRLDELQLQLHDTSRNPGDHRLVLDHGLAALPPDVFAKIADEAFEIVEREGHNRRMPQLYLRAADVGPKAFAFYKRQFLDFRTDVDRARFAVLAICRLGRADSETITAMKQDYRESTYKAEKSALFVTLLKLGERRFVEADAHSRIRWWDGWADAVLANQGLTQTGPNNCREMEAWGMDWPELLRPGLHQRNDGRWTAQPRTAPSAY